jgi:hypothetical protein
MVGVELGRMLPAPLRVVHERVHTQYQSAAKPLTGRCGVLVAAHVPVHRVRHRQVVAAGPRLREQQRVQALGTRKPVHGRPPVGLGDASVCIQKAQAQAGGGYGRCGGRR